MGSTVELDGLNELRAALIEERQIIVASVRRLRTTRRQKGTFVLGDGSEAGPRLAEVQRQIEVVESIIATLSGSGELTRPAATEPHAPLARTPADSLASARIRDVAETFET